MHVSGMKCRVLLVVTLCVSLFASAAERSQVEIGKRVDAIIGKMTLEEKIDYLGGYNAFYIRAIPRLGVPELKMADGPMGVRNYGPSTAFPAGVAMAATWNPALVKRVGAMMGADARARGVHFLLAPGMNIYRAPMNGRNFEYFGEDPYLASRIAVADIEGIQSQGVIATAKHFLGNNQEWDRHHVSSDIDERTLREIYLPAFEASVKEAHVGAIMDSYNLVNGTHMTQNGHFNTDVLRKEWGFTGIVMSDWDATYDGVAAANGGLDLEMPNGKFMNRATLLAAVKEGKVTEAVIDEKVRRILRTAMEFGFFDRKQTDTSISLFNHEARDVAAQAARESMVLLKNNGLLPLDKSRVKTIAVLGPVAQFTPTGGGGSSKVNPASSISFLEGISTFVGPRANVLYSTGISRLSDIYDDTRLSVAADGATPGVKAEYFNESGVEGKPALVRTDERINFRWGQGSYAPNAPADHFSARWTGYYMPEASGDFKVYVSSNDSYRLYVDDRRLMERGAQQSGDSVRVATLRLEAGKAYQIRLEFTKSNRRSGISFGVAPSIDPALVQATEMAKKADVVVLCVGYDSSSESEGFDRTFALPRGQDELIKEVLKANKNAVVVLTAGGNVNMSGWVDTTPALLHAWYAGQEGGTALAEILFGDVNPSGKLPATFERRWEDNATYNSYYDPDGDKRVAYSEGIFVGYRHFDRAGVKPLFPFGYGLSYTTFKYSNLKITPATSQVPVTVSFDVTNTGSREGAEVAQVYVSDTQSKVLRPAKELKGFEKVTLKPGETKTVKLSLDRRAFSYYDVSGKKWSVGPDVFKVLVGGSSSTLELRGEVRVVD